MCGEEVQARELGDGGTLAAWLRAGRADAVLLRPDRVVLDVVPAGGGIFEATAAWPPLLCIAACAPLLCTARRPEQTA